MREFLGGSAGRRAAGRRVGGSAGGRSAGGGSAGWRVHFEGTRVEPIVMPLTDTTLSQGAL